MYFLHVLHDENGRAALVQASSADLQFSKLTGMTFSSAWEKLGLAQASLGRSIDTTLTERAL